MKGKVVRLENMTVVPFELLPGNNWNCVVIESEHPSYPVGGYNISVPLSDLEKASLKAQVDEVAGLPKRMAAAQAKAIELFQNFGVVSIMTTMGITLPFNITMTVTWTREQAVKMGLLKDDIVPIDPTLSKGSSDG